MKRRSDTPKAPATQPMTLELELEGIVERSVSSKNRVLVWIRGKKQEFNNRTFTEIREEVSQTLRRLGPLKA